MRMSPQEFDEMKANNPHLKISENSAHRGASSGMDWEAIKKTEGSSKTASKRLGTIKKAKPSKSKSKPYISPHAKRLAYFAAHPDKIKKNQEHYEQVRLFDDVERHYPEIYEMLAAIPNGGIRDDKTASNMRAEGQKRGYPDITLDVPRGIYPALKVEMKSSIGSVRTEQKDWHGRLRRHGNCVVVCYGYEAAKAAVLEYWNLASDAEMSAEVYKHAL
ncbi:VRR-NUC domain-containing protein [Vibrio europaeus]|uniref:VRR-NUC domain-containing protein n=1 Tax=Vibrio europaeus TaxID=300876 RepID=UPI00233E78D1|nr:VRR-NUC domain-containing protein [Vibrio europaeus]MDC5753572.1 VRR-NUC domain-containing protein [Vibrio europaeus]MDC5816515.1 VRR-NUC domain-containing protein [Vibrio europaeus]